MNPRINVHLALSSVSHLERSFTWVSINRGCLMSKLCKGHYFAISSIERYFLNPIIFPYLPFFSIIYPAV